MPQRVENNKQIKSITQSLIDELSKKLIGIYLYGSVINGGLKPKSDLDFLVLISDSLNYEEKKHLINKIQPHSAKINEKTNLRYVEITVIVQSKINPWHYPPEQEFIYGEWLREDYAKGFVPPTSISSDLAILLYQASKNSIKLYGQNSLEKILPQIPFEDVKRAIKDTMDDVVENYKNDEQNAILTLCRMNQTMLGQKIYSKDVAGELQAAHAPAQHKSIILTAVKSYEGLITVNWKEYEVDQTIGYLYKELLTLT